MNEGTDVQGYPDLLGSRIYSVRSSLNGQLSRTGIKYDAGAGYDSNSSSLEMIGDKSNHGIILHNSLHITNHSKYQAF